MPGIKYAHVIELHQAWMAKDEAIIYFGYKLHRSLFQKLLKEFKEHKVYGSGYRLVTSNMPIINIKLFDEFLVWRDKNKYKRNKR
ncbi:hypothetical protein GIX45_17590 [Erwinia sp. CPCC 100877]|nr:hypothetical protein [Erwinia sp. CPCC 100877]